MIDTVTIGGTLTVNPDGSGTITGGTPADPCMVLAQVSILHGRGGFGEAGQPMSATIVIEHPPGSMPTWQSGDLITLDGPVGRMFSGRIASRALTHLETATGRVGRFVVTAAGPLAVLGVRKIGDVPWPQETGTARATHILQAGGTPWAVDGAVDLQVMARDVDAQPAYDLLIALADDTSAAVFDTPDGLVVYQALSGRSRPVVPFMWSDFDPSLTWDGFDPFLTWDGAPPSLGDLPSPTSRFPVVLPCDTVVWEPEWSSAEATIINDIAIGYGPADPQAKAELQDAASIAAHQRRYLYLGTQLATLADATARASHIITTQSVERWQIGDILVALDALDPDTYAAVLGLVCGDHVTLQGLPQPAPAIDWTGIVEGWTYTMWADYPALYLWSAHPGHLTWDDLDSVDVLEAA
jgi:hypothetical protein